MSQSNSNDGASVDSTKGVAASPETANGAPTLAATPKAPPLKDTVYLPLTGITGSEPTGVLLHQLTKRNELFAGIARELKGSLASLIIPTAAEQAAAILAGENPWVTGLSAQADTLRKAGALNDWLSGLPNRTSPIRVESDLSSEVGKLREDIAKNEAIVRRQEFEIRLKAEELKRAIESKTTTETQLDEFRQASSKQAEEIANLQKRFDLSFILSRVSTVACQRPILDAELQARFTKAGACSAYVLALDIRRSTELMLRAKTPELFAEFLDSLCSLLVETVKQHFGVVDKFTGDGLLAYFPDFFSGPDSAYWVLATARACHKVFDESYRANRHCFNVVLKDVGLGIGIDYGEVHLVRVTGELTAIGSPVVYACRLSGSPNGCTYLNFPAYSAASTRLNSHFKSEEVSFEAKHEGSVVCHRLKDLSDDYRSTVPKWVSAQPPN
jgi:class 3 adenylate cyclase